MPTASKPMIRVGIGGWNFAPWRGTFYPEGLTHKRELEYASRKLTSIEINATYYGAQKPESFARWYDETPDDFVFSVKATRYATDRPVLAEAAPSIDRFFRTGVMGLKEKLGPINWQFLPTKEYDPADFEAFLKLLPSSVDGRAVRHVVEVRHASFRTAEFIALLREYQVGVVFTDNGRYPKIPDLTAPFVYARLQLASKKVSTGYPPEALDTWAARARVWAKGGGASDLEHVAEPERTRPRLRDVFIYMINGFKPRAPAAAMALLERLSG